MASKLTPAEKIQRVSVEVEHFVGEIHDPLERAKVCQNARKALNDLNAQIAEVYRTAAMEMRKSGMTYNQIAQALGVSQHRFYHMMNRAKTDTDLRKADAV